MRVERVAPVVVAALAAAAAFALSATTAPVPSASAQPTPGPTASPTPVADDVGRFIYLRDCAWCHGDQGQGSIYGPSLVGVGAASADFMLSTGRMPVETPEERPQQRAPLYDPAVIAEVVDYVASFGPGPPIPSVDPASGDLGEGARLYEENCAACHSSQGIGGALTSGDVAPDLAGSTATEIAEAIRIGGAGVRTGEMPKFGPETLTDDEVNSIVRYVLYLQRPEDRGGAPLGHIGPVAEGFVALTGGLVLLLLFVRWIGRRAAVREAEEEGDHGS